jgi:heme/copper-type cytochrome/quinol oxidase subunit 2
VQATLFWLTGGAFFALQLGMLLYLLYVRPDRGLTPTEERRHRVEIVWTLVPASILVAVALMVSGLTGSSWARIRTADAHRGTIALHHHDAAPIRDTTR